MCPLPVDAAYSKVAVAPISSGRGTVIFSYIYIGLAHYLGIQKNKFQYFFFWGGGQKNEYFWGYEDYVDI